MSKKQPPRAFGNQNFRVHQVGDEKVKFHPISYNCMQRMQRLAKPITRALAGLFADKQNDCTTLQRTFSDGSGGGTEIVTEGIEPALAEQRYKQRLDSFELLVSTVTDPDMADVIGELLSDSLREWDWEDTDPAEWVRSLLAPDLLQLLIGFGKANAKVLGPLEDRVLAALAEAADAAGSPETATKEETAGPSSSEPASD